MLALFMLMVAANQLLWITFAPISEEAASFFGVSDLMIGMLSTSFLIVYIVISIPASWIIDRYGIKVGAGISAILTGVFGLMRGMEGADYRLVLLSQIGIALGQPFLLNSITKLAATWFPPKERGTATGLGTLAIYAGILTGMVLTPLLSASKGMLGMMHLYGTLSAVVALLFLVLSKKPPKYVPGESVSIRRSMGMEGFRMMFRSKDFWLLMVIFFVGLGLFNGVTTWIDQIISPRGFTETQAGYTGGIIVAGGILGALIMPMLSDRFRRRTPFIMLALAGATVGLIGLTFTKNYTLLLLFGATLGFFLLSSGPIGFQYGAEITYPASEGASNGWLLLMGQIAGIVFIFGLNGLKSRITGSMTYPLTGMIVLLLFSFYLSTKLKEADSLLTEEAPDQELEPDTVRDPAHF